MNKIKRTDEILEPLFRNSPKWLTPNHLSGLRLVMAIPLIVLILMHYNKTAGGIFLFAAFLDWLDGAMARICNQVTKLGAFLDPLADKIVNAAAFLGFIYTIKSDRYLYLVIPIVIIDLALLLIATLKYSTIFNFNWYFTRKFKITTHGANRFGKIKMVLQVVVLAFLMLFNPATSFNLHQEFIFLPRHLTLLDLALPLLATCIVFGALSFSGHLQAIKKR